MLIDLLSQLPFRKCFRPLFLDRHLVVRVRDFIEMMRARADEQRKMGIIGPTGRGKVGGKKGGWGKNFYNYKGWKGKGKGYGGYKQDFGGKDLNKGGKGKGGEFYGKGGGPPGGKAGYGEVMSKSDDVWTGDAWDNQPFEAWFAHATGKKGDMKGAPNGSMMMNIFAEEQEMNVPFFTTEDEDYSKYLAENIKQDEKNTTSAEEEHQQEQNVVWFPDQMLDPAEEQRLLEAQQGGDNKFIGFAPSSSANGGMAAAESSSATHQKTAFELSAEKEDSMVFASGIYPEDDIWRLSEQLLDILAFYERFEVDDVTGAALHRQDVLQMHYDDHNALRKICFSLANEALGLGAGASEQLKGEEARRALEETSEEMRGIALSHVGDFQTRGELRKAFAKLPYAVLREITHQLCFLDVHRDSTLTRMDEAVSLYLEQRKASRKQKKAEQDGGQADEALKSSSKADNKLVALSKEAKSKLKSKSKKEEIALRKIFLEVLYQKLEAKEAQIDKVNALPLYPAEDVIWDKNLVPEDHYQNEYALALPKLNLQFLTIHDYLLRNFHLYRLESTHGIRDDLRDVIPRLRAIQDENCRGGVRWLGSSRMALPVESFQITETKAPRVGETVPSAVKCEIRFSISSIRSPHVQREWSSLKEHDVVFLVIIQPPEQPYLGNPTDLEVNEFARAFGIREIRGVEVLELLDGENNVISDSSVDRKEPIGDERVVQGLYDPAQFQLDNAPEIDLFSGPPGTAGMSHPIFHLIVRRDPKVNNFKAVLETIRDLMNSDVSAVVPRWLHRLFLGYGDPLETQYKILGSTPEIDFRDTFLDRSHVFESFAECEDIRIDEDCKPPYKLHFVTGSKDEGVNASKDDGEDQMEVDANMVDVDQDATSTAKKSKMKRKKAQAKVQFTSKIKSRKGAGTGNKVDASHASGANTNAANALDIVDLRITGSTYIVKNPGPYPFCIPNRNKVRFTPVQIDAIRSGVNHGLTMVVGPPGTGKTDTAVQIVNLLFHNFPDQKIVLVAHSNQALNDLFDKICQLDIPERYLVRLGRGIDELDSERDFSKHGRIDFMLKRRLELLQLVAKLARCLGVPEQDAAYTCESAKFFFLQHVQSAWELFLEKLQMAGPDGKNLSKVLDASHFGKKAHLAGSGGADTGAVPPDQMSASQAKNARQKKKRKLDKTFVKGEDLNTTGQEAAAPGPQIDAEAEKQVIADQLLEEHNGSVVGALFPFLKFFDDVPYKLFNYGDYTQDLDEAEGCFRYLKTLVKEIDECLPFELLRSGTDRGNYLVTTHARIIAMTCTHAALTRANLVKLNFQYDNLIMEESGQILEVETLIPMLLQKADVAGESRLKRVVLIGDHHQLPPVVKNRAFQKYGKLDQSLFTRFIRLNVPHVTLDAQGRARPSIASLYSWRYDNMRNLPIVEKKVDYRLANTGLIYDYQFINVPDYNGKGETTPMPYYFQNEGEAEYAVALFMFMRLLGYPAGSISILTTYNGQKALIKDVIQKRCAWNPLYGWPKQITTVDKYQGQQNDYIILSLVRTSTVGHLRDVRRLVVAMSRSKLGLYVLGRFKLFSQCFELQTVLKMFKKRPLSLALHENYMNEFWPCERFLDTSDDYAERHCKLIASGLEELWSVIGEMQQRKATEMQGLLAGGAENLEYMQPPAEL
ncbi:unnamed protein product [Amoebophrya sp. A25]|nr:unnamed protein product [Amoebophrya sp. A25]|eukprot:GSA25T00019323001.1